MHIVRLKGRVFPPSCVVNIHSLPKVSWEVPESNLSLEFELKIENSIIEITCEASRHNPSDFVHIYVRAIDTCRSATNLVAFVQGISLTIFLDTLIDQDGNESIIQLSDPALPLICKQYGIDQKLAAIYPMVVAEPAIFMGFHDLIEAITSPHVAPVNCARVVEGLRQLVASAAVSTSQEWDLFRRTLQIDRSYIQLITDTSIKPRHGKRVHIEGPVVIEITYRTWHIMCRFLEFRRRGNLPLSVSEFPLLVG